MEQTAVVIADAPDVDLAPYADLLSAATWIIAADGGARHLLGASRLPDLVIGDFDSLAPHLLGQLIQDGVKVEQHPVHKNETDLELALLRAVAFGATTITVLGALGGRPDQHLANLQLLTHPALGDRTVRLLDRDWSIFLIQQRATITGAPGDVVSLLPMTATVTGIVTEGLRYPLKHEALALGPARGVSNTLLDTSATVTIESGLLLAMHQTSSK